MRCVHDLRICSARCPIPNGGWGGALQAPSCQCSFMCPNITRSPPYTRCPAMWTGTNKLDFDIYLPLIDEFVKVEVHFCCRVRQAPCFRYVTIPVQVSCETAITCIRVAKERLLDHAKPQEPLEPRALRQQLLEGVLDKFMCDNPCQMGLPPQAGAYEWVFSFPACLYWEKSNQEQWCLTSCGDRYCVHALAVRNAGFWGYDKDGNPIYTAAVAEHVTSEFEYTPQGCAPDNRCTSDGCLEYFKPSCEKYGGKVLWRLER